MADRVPLYYDTTLGIPKKITAPDLIDASVLPPSTSSSPDPYVYAFFVS